MNIKETVFPSELSNENIVLRQLQDIDKQAIYDIYSDVESAKLDDWIPFKTVEEASSLIDQSKKILLIKQNYDMELKIYQGNL